MKTLLVLILAFGSVGLVVQEKESKTQPKEVVLGKDSQSDKYGEVPFNHENHALKKYSIDGQSVLSCVECHHTDQPPAGLKAPLKTSERAVVLTAEVLTAADAKAVKTCRACHLQAGDDSANDAGRSISRQTCCDEADERSRLPLELQPLSRQSNRGATGTQRKSSGIKRLPPLP